jgi:hypothetical protein
LFGGLLVRLAKIPLLFKPFYFGSVIAVTQRALIANDLECCYMTSTCNSIAASIQANTQAPDQPQGFQSSLNIAGQNSSSLLLSSFCPPGLAFSGDGSDEGNLGRLYLQVRGSI